jgi:hypothetical protein
MGNTELCVNLWFCFDKDSGYVDAIAGRGYMLSGTDEQKNIILKTLSGSDYLNSQWLPIPEKYQTNIIDIENNKTTNFPGVIHASDVDILGMGLFETVFQQIESLNQVYLPIKNTNLVKVPDEPLFMITPVENNDGKIKAIVST